MTQITEATFAAVFEKQAQQTPDHPAVKAGENLLTYRELDEQANQLAHHLRAQGPEMKTLSRLLWTGQLKSWYPFSVS
ncbi:AMP-binding protein [Bacillus subtilis]